MTIYRKKTLTENTEKLFKAHEKYHTNEKQTKITMNQYIERLQTATDNNIVKSLTKRKLKGIQTPPQIENFLTRDHKIMYVGRRVM